MYLVSFLGLAAIAQALSNCLNAQSDSPFDSTPAEYQSPSANLRYALSCATTMHRGSKTEIINGLNITVIGISTKLVEKLKSSLPIALDLAKRASEATAANEFPNIFQAYFKTSDPDIRKNVADRYAAMAKHLASAKNQDNWLKGSDTFIQCAHDCSKSSGRSGGAMWTSQYTGVVTICPRVSSLFPKTSEIPYK
jgi:hypothetical protein